MKATKRTVFEVDYNELDRAISEEFGIDFEIVAYEYLSNGSSKTFNVEPKAMDVHDYNNLKSGKLHYMTQSLLDEMCYRGKIIATEYVVKIFW